MRPSMRRIVLAAAALVLLIPLVAASAPRLRDHLRLAHELSGKPWSIRRTIIFGDYYSALREVRRIIPEEATVALVPKRPDDGDTAMFSVYHLYPRASRVFWSLSAYYRNEHEGVDRKTPRPEWVVVIDHSSRPIMTILRDESGTLREVAKR